METFVDIISDIGAQISKIKRCRINQQTLITSIGIIWILLMGAESSSLSFILRFSLPKIYN